MTKSISLLVFLLIQLLVLLVVPVNGQQVGVNKRKKRNKNIITLTDPKNVKITTSLRNICSNTNKQLQPITGKKNEKHLSWLIAASGDGSLLLNGSPQKLASCWMIYYDTISQKQSNINLYLQRYAVAVLHYATTKSNSTPWDWPMAADDPSAVQTHGQWMNTKLSECKWYGVVCHMITHHIIEFNLGFLKLDGIIPREISLLYKLKDIDIHGNDFQGVVPHRMIDSLYNLQYLRLHMNGFFGSIHREIIGLTKLKELNLFGNYFAGTIPTELSSLQQLEIIDLYANQLSGTIPSHLGLLKKLQYLDVHDNNLIGTMPIEICNRKIPELISDCLGPLPEVTCTCCTICCRGLPDFKCITMKTGQEITFGR